METSKENLPAVIDQRYYHFVVLELTKADTIQLIRQVILKECHGHIRFDAPDASPFELVDYKYKSFFKYSTSLFDDFSLTQDGKHPFVYDILYLSFQQSSKFYTLLAFPFFAFATEVIQSLLKIDEIRINCSFIFVDQEKSIEIMKQPNFPSGSLTILNIVHLSYSLKKVPYISSIALTGVDPLRSDLFEDIVNSLNVLVIDDKVKESDRPSIKPQKIVLSTKLSLDKLNLKHVDSSKSMSAKVHADGFGNFKFYVHQDGFNLPILFYVFKALDDNGLLKITTLNPLDRYIEDEISIKLT